MKKSKRNKLLKTTKAKVIMAVIILLLLVAGVRALMADNNTQSGNKNTAAANSSETPNGAQPNLNPPTAEEKKDTEAHKDTLVQQQANSGNQTSSSVTPIITSASADGVYAFISGVFEDGGICTFSFTKNTEAFTKTTTGFKNATSTNCTPLSLSASDFPSAGTWTVILSYNSTTVSKVNSQPAKIQR
jgi:cytoskeletal protein RodZ